MNSIDIHHKNAVSKVLNIIKNGGVVIYPTDTIYGFGVDAFNNDAIERLNQIKGRNEPMSVLAPDRNTALSWGSLSQDETELVADKLKGYTTIIYAVKTGVVSHKIMGKDYTLGVRLPQNDFCNQMANLSEHPITSTSVNKHGNKALNEPKKIVSSFGNEIDLFVNGGNLEGNKESSIYKLERGKLIQLRD